jgi:hypothetical protein
VRGTGIADSSLALFYRRRKINDISIGKPPALVTAPLAAAARSAPADQVTVSPGIAAFEHPDALRHFRLIDSDAGLQQALEFPW